MVDTVDAGPAHNLVSSSVLIEANKILNIRK